MIFNNIKKIYKKIFHPKKFLVRVCIETYHNRGDIMYLKLSFYVIPISNASVRESCNYDMTIVNDLSYLSSFINNYLVTKSRNNYYINIITLELNSDIGDLSPKIKKVKLFNNKKLKIKLKKELQKFFNKCELSTEFDVTISVK